MKKVYILSFNMEAYSADELILGIFESFNDALQWWYNNYGKDEGANIESITNIDEFNNYCCDSYELFVYDIF